MLTLSINGMINTMRYAQKRHYEWSREIAYSVGLMASDGCLQKDSRHLDLTSVDIEQLQNFSKALGRDLPISKKDNISDTPAYRVQFSDVAYYDFLLAAGLTPAKSHTIATLNIPDEYYADFLRGLFDGDGSCYAYMDKRWKSSYMFYATFTAASAPFLRYIQVSNSTLLGTSSGSLRVSGNAYILSYAKADAKILFSKMYYSDSVLCLKRKHAKLSGFTKRSKNDTITQV